MSPRCPIGRFTSGSQWRAIKSDTSHPRGVHTGYRTRQSRAHHARSRIDSQLPVWVASEYAIAIGAHKHTWKASRPFSTHAIRTIKLGACALLIGRLNDASGHIRPDVSSHHSTTPFVLAGLRLRSTTGLLPTEGNSIASGGEWG